MRNVPPRREAREIFRVGVKRRTFLSGRLRKRTATMKETAPRRKAHILRVRPTLKERQRIWETRYYERFGFPRLRNTRYALIGRYKPKPKCY